MAKKWPAALSTNVLPSAAALRDLDPAPYQLGVNGVEPPSPIGSGPYGLWVLTQLRPSSGPVERSDWHASFGQIVRSDRTTGRSPNSPESARNSTNTSTGRKTAMSAQQWRQ